MLNLDGIVSEETRQQGMQTLQTKLKLSEWSECNENRCDEL